MMAKVTAPLFSVSASGNMASGTMQYRSGNWGTHVYKPLAPGKQNKGKPTATQAARRAEFLQVRDAWHALSVEANQGYQVEANTIGGLNGWNLFVSRGLTGLRLPGATLLTRDGLPILNKISEIILID
jgi:hypothetical protein